MTGHGTSDRDLGTLISQYREHREALRQLSASAPDGKLAERYERLVEGLSRTIDRLVEMQAAEQEAEASGDDFATPLVDGPAPAVADEPVSGRISLEEREAQSRRADEEVEGAGTWDRPFVRDSSGAVEEETGSRLPMILILAVAVPLLGGLIWMQATGEPEASDREEVVEQPAEPVIEEETRTAPPLEVTPASHDYGTIRTGTRASHIFTVRNNSESPVELSVDRSECRCLWYDLPDGTIPPGESGRLIVTVDGGRASGALAETITVRGAEEEVLAEIDIDATIQ